MNRINRTIPALNRAVLGGFAGAVICLALVAVVGQAASLDPPDWAGWPLFSVVCGGGWAAGAVFGVVLGARELRGRARAVTLGMLAGCLLGLLGAVAYASAASARADQLLVDKFSAQYRLTGIAVGVPAGCLLGGVAGFTAWGLRRR